MRPNQIFEGAAVRVRVTFTDPDTDVVAIVQEPVMFQFFPPTGANPAPVAGTKISTGVFEVIQVATMSGRWRASATSSGTEPAVAAAAFSVSEADFG